MLIRALTEYYEILASRGVLVGEEYSRVNIHRLVSLTPDGKIAGIIDQRRDDESKDARGKVKIRKVPTEMTLPRRTDFPGIKANIVEHRPMYLFGLDYDKQTQSFAVKTPKVSEAKAIKPMRSHEAFVEETLKFLEGLDSPIVRAFRSFTENWNPEKETENPFLLEVGKDYPTAGFAFCLAGNPGVLLHDDAQVKSKWESMYQQAQTAGEDAVIGQCAVTGEMAPVARLHGKLTGLAKGPSMGTLLVCYNNDSETSYGAQQSYNANISETAAYRYIAAANHLIHDSHHRIFIDDLTVIFWAMTKEKEYADWLSLLLADKVPDGMDEDEMDKLLESAYSRVHEGKSGIVSADLPENLDPGVECYVAGLKPNSSRAAVCFVHRQQFGEIVNNIMLHQLDMQPFPGAKSIALWQIKKELISPKSTNETIDPSLMTKLMHAVIHASPYPQSLLAQVIRRVRTDHDEENKPPIKLNPTRIGIIKACINRQARYMGQKEEITLSLDTKNTNPAYLCGRLFAVLEQAQQEAAESRLNRTIKDAYFSSASSTPAVIFPKLLKVGQYHLKKAKNTEEFTRTIGIILNMLGNEFPHQLSLVDQGKFIIGYYHQNNAMTYRKEEKKNDDQ